MTTNLPNFIAKLSLKELGAHIKCYYELYTRPVESWKKAYSQRKTGYDFTVLNIIYYSILALILIQDIYFALQVVLLEILVTLVPLLILLIPFLISTNVFKIYKKWTKLFRVLLIIKFQLIPPLVIMTLLAKWSELELLYLLIENGIWLIYICFILAVPLINSISFVRKILWMALNYVSLLIGLIIIGLALSFIDKEFKLLSKLQLKTPNQEYQNALFQSSLSMLRICDKEYVAIFETVDNKTAALKKVQFATPELAMIIMQNSRNETIKTMRKLDSLLSITDSSYVSTVKKHELDSVITLNKPVLDSIQEEAKKYFYIDLKLYKKAKDESTFESNKEYFEIYFKYLKHYEQLFVNLELRNEIVNELTPFSIAYISDNDFVALYSLTNIYIFDKKEELEEMRDALDKRHYKANFSANLFFYPLFKILDILGLY